MSYLTSMTSYFSLHFSRSASLSWTSTRHGVHGTNVAKISLEQLTGCVIISQDAYFNFWVLSIS